MGWGCCQTKKAAGNPVLPCSLILLPWFTFLQMRLSEHCIPGTSSRREALRTSPPLSHHRKYTRRWCISTSSPPQKLSCAKSRQPVLGILNAFLMPFRGHYRCSSDSVDPESNYDAHFPGCSPLNFLWYSIVFSANCLPNAKHFSSSSRLGR